MASEQSKSAGEPTPPDGYHPPPEGTEAAARVQGAGYSGLSGGVRYPVRRVLGGTTPLFELWTFVRVCTVSQNGYRTDIKTGAWTRLNGLALVVGWCCRRHDSRPAECIKPLILLTRNEWRRRMGIEPTWDFVEPHHGFEDQERHQVALRLQAH